jgi:predicted transcriptional regulator of viral defense system
MTRFKVTVMVYNIPISYILHYINKGGITIEKALEDLQVVTTEDVAEYLQVTKEHASVILHRWTLKQKAEKIRKGMYHIKASSDSKRPPNRYIVAAKLAHDAVLCYHSALELHGVAHQVFYTVFVHSSKRFNPFTYRNVTYRHVELRAPDFDVAEFTIHGHKVKSTSLERTLLDCVHNLRFSGGWEEFYNSVNTQLKIDLIRVFTDTFHVYNSKSTYRKIGFLIDHMQDRWSLNHDLFRQMKDILKTKYLGREELKRTRLFSELLNSKYELKVDEEWNIRYPKIEEAEEELVF